MRPTSEISIYLGIVDKMFPDFYGQKSNKMLSTHWGPNWTISKDSLVSSKAKLAGRCDDITLPYAALPY